MPWKALKCTLGWVFIVGLLAQGQTARPSAIRAIPNTQYGNLPLMFEANQGQLSSKVNFIARGPGYHAFLTSEGMVLSLRGTSAPTRPTDAGVGPSDRAILWFRLLGAAKNSPPVGENQQSGSVNYFVGRNPSKWQRNVPTYAQVRYKNIYRGIDLLYYGNHRQMEYDFEVAPGGDPGQIRFAIEGANHIKIASDGNLLIDTAVGTVRFQPPVLYQVSHGQRVPVQGTYVLEGTSTIRFRVASYDPRNSLIIDPVLTYSTYLGGSGNEQIAGIAVDALGNAYVVGSSDSPDFPLNTFGATASGDSQAFVAKIDASGSKLLFCDYLGGSGPDNGYGLALDAVNNVFVTGSTGSSDFPLVSPFQQYPGSNNAFLAKISPDGSSLMYSTYFGGNGGDVPVGVAVDANGNAVIAGYTSSTNLPLANAYQDSVSANQGGFYGQYGFVTKFSSDGSSLLYSTYIGGNSNTPSNCGGYPCWGEPFSMINGLAIDKDGSAYVAGTTNTYNFPVSAGAYQNTDPTTMNGDIGFVSKFGNSGELGYSTYFGGDLLTAITTIAVDTNGSAYISGLALNDGTFPLTSTSICDPVVDPSACNFAFVSKFDAAGANLMYSTFLGPNNYAVPRQQRVCICRSRGLDI
jgi:hypothetical protein